MSLYESFMTPCVLLNEIRKPDGEGGFYTEWEDGVEIMAAITDSVSTLSQIAEKQGVTSNYTVTTYRNVILKFPDVIKRLSDGKLFRITTDGSDVLSPNVSDISISSVKAEKWELPS